MAYICNMIFIETPIFSREIKKVLSDEEYHKLQISIIFRPDQGKIIPGSNGLRKLRWKIPGKGKRGGMRIIYYWDEPDTIYMIFPYKKVQKEDLTKDQIRKLSKVVRRWLK